MIGKKKKRVQGSIVIRTPEEEFKSYVEQKIEQALRYEENEQAELYREALELGLELLNSIK